MRLKAFFKNKAVKIILSVLAIIVFGFILLNLAFLFAWLFQTAIVALLRLIWSEEALMQYLWFPLLVHASFMIVIILISWLVIKSKLKTLPKAIYMTVPFAVIFMTIGIIFYQIQFLVYLLSTIFLLGVIYYLYRTKQPWLYYFSLFFIVVLILLSMITGTEI